MTDKVFNELENLVTESRNPDSENIDSKTTAEILQIMNQHGPHNC